MGFTPEYRLETEQKLSKVAMIKTKPMFGGVGIYSEGLFFALIAEGKLYFKVDDSNRQDFVDRGMQPFFPYENATPMHYWELPGGVIDEPKELSIWVDKAIRVAEAAQSKKKK